MIKNGSPHRPRLNLGVEPLWLMACHKKIGNTVAAGFSLRQTISFKDAA
jgi:hypothetical protein